MKTISLPFVVAALCLVIFSGASCGHRLQKMKNFSERLPAIELKEKEPQRYLMTAEYFNKDIFGNQGGKIAVSGEYTRGLDSGYVRWNNVSIVHANNPSEGYGQKVKQEYMENLSYLPSPNLLEAPFFEKFQAHPDNIFARNLIWDMMAIEGYAWNYYDSLQLNVTYKVPDIQGAFDMAEIGTYNHAKITLNWLGVSPKNGKLCAIIEYRALDNKLEMHTETMKSRGSEWYWGKTWISLENKQIEYAEMYSNTVQELEISGLPDKLLASILRILTVERL